MNLSRSKKILTILGVSMVLIVLLSILKIFLFSVTGYRMTSGSIDSRTSMNMVGEERSTKSFQNPLASGVMLEDVAFEPSSPHTVGSDAEMYESVSYDVTYRKTGLEEVCNTLEALKPRKNIVFEYATRNENSCSYRFKVERTSIDALLVELQNLDPETFTASTETVKKQLVEYSDRLSILLRKQEILEKTLEDALSAYDTVTSLAVDTKDADVLSRIISSKLNDIARLTNERIQLAQQIEMLSKNVSEVEDSIDYVYVSVRVEKIEFLNLTSIKNSWMYEIRAFVETVNETLQGITLGTLALVLFLTRSIVYLGILLVVGIAVLKYGWRFSKGFWKE